MNNDIKSIVEKNFDSEIKDLQTILRMNSVHSSKSVTADHPLGENLTKCLDKFLAIASLMGFKTKNVDNMIGWAEIGQGDTLYGVLVHLDTVPFGDETKWTKPPLGAEIVDGKLYARGSTDDKGPAMAALYALYALKESGAKLNKRFRLIVGLDEETKMRCAERYIKTEESPSFSFSPDASFPAVNGEKGILVFHLRRSFVRPGLEPLRLLGIVGGERSNIVPDTAKAYFGGNTAKIRIALEELNDNRLTFAYVDDFLEVTAHGKSAHAMNPEKGVNAILILFAALAQIEFAPNEVLRFVKNFHDLMGMGSDGDGVGLDMSDEVSGPLTLNAATVNYKDRDILMKFDVRYPITADPLVMESKAEEAVKKLGGLYHLEVNRPPLYIPENLPELQILLKSYEKVTGDSGKPITIGGRTYCMAFENSVSFGGNFPGDEELAHEANEYATLENIKKMTLIYAEALKGLNEYKG